MITLQNIRKSYPIDKTEQKLVLDNISFEVPDGEFITIFGPNGCGKSTLLNLLAKLDEPTSGKLIFSEQNENTAYIFQDYKANLLPWKKAWENIAQPLLWQGMSKPEARKRVDSIVGSSDIEVPTEAYPHTLSGGQSQLISIMRSIIIEPTLLLADEPFSALDLVNRWRLSLVLRRLWSEYKFKCVFISHDLDEAIFLGNKLILLSNLPTKITEIIDIPLPDHRNRDLLVSSEFSAIKNKVLSKIKF